MFSKISRGNFKISTNSCWIFHDHGVLRVGFPNNYVSTTRSRFSKTVPTAQNHGKSHIRDLQHRNPSSQMRRTFFNETNQNGSDENKNESWYTVLLSIDKFRNEIRVLLEGQWRKFRTTDNTEFSRTPHEISIRVFQDAYEPLNSSSTQTPTFSVRYYLTNARIPKFNPNETGNDQSGRRARHEWEKKFSETTSFIYNSQQLGGRVMALPGVDRKRGHKHGDTSPILRAVHTAIARVCVCGLPRPCRVLVTRREPLPGSAHWRRHY